MAQAVKRLALGFGSGHDLMVRGFEPYKGLCSDRSCLGFSLLSLSLCPSPTRALSLSLSLKKKKKIDNLKKIKVSYFGCLKDLHF